MGTALHSWKRDYAWRTPTQNEGTSWRLRLQSSPIFTTYQECSRKKQDLEERERKMRADIAEMEKQKKKCGRDIEVWGVAETLRYGAWPRH